MKRKSLRFGHGFRIAIGNDKSQAAEMVLAAGESEGGSGKRHQGADQWLFVVSGSGKAVVDDKRYPLSTGTLVLIEAGDTHEISNTGRGILKTVNFYVPPVYTPAGDELPTGGK